ncbi:DUF4430 domain-containing protein [Tissierella praeacuta]|uniref:DUF4430 domain-containing protein n=1 Tax=Tissierella praeacuta TaxID=43131 RepID=UPI000E07EB63|nr:DUF4430 domain-containing protein [Tissierella praeacuta]MBU5256656.1 DUF4430 domain-containing protein [Tissierella praeacuta]SUP00330.1 Uncharacterised protein [Tissierella praeacuta]
MKLKIKNIFLLLLLSVAIISVSFQVVGIVKDYFSTNRVFAKSNSLDIEYWIDHNSEENLEEQEAESLLAQLRNQKKQDKDLSQGDFEHKESDIDVEEKKESTWKKLLESKGKDKRVTQNPIIEETKKHKDNIHEELKKEELINGFQEEINKSRENSKKKSEEIENKKEKENENNKSTEEEKVKAIAEAKKAKEKKEREEKEKDKKDNIVTMHIRCDTAVAKGMAEDPKWQGIVPPSGVILSTTKFKIKEGDTVLDVLIAAKDQYKFHMKYKGSGASAYIEGINNLYEFDGGRWSGWMYCVNNWYPNYGAGVYTLKGGDVIEWNYTCDLGKDLGQDWLGN